ncbi:MAG: hypothetical protein IH614_00685 [Desulfuromonadales bacterium]|nr:hypothetical protein [Desulfuromonadales bacterium]
MENDHREMVQTIVDDLQTRNFRAIAADALREQGLAETDGYFQISSQRWYHPDIQARSGDRLFIYEVETEETFDLPETRDKLEVLANAASKANGRFFLVVPERLQDSAHRLLTEMHIDWGEVWGISEWGKV